MSSHPEQTQSHPTDEFLSKVLDPQFVSFLPRRIEDSANGDLGLSIQTIRLC